MEEANAEFVKGNLKGARAMCFMALKVPIAPVRKLEAYYLLMSMDKREGILEQTRQNYLPELYRIKRGLNSLEYRGADRLYERLELNTDAKQEI